MKTKRVAAPSHEELFAKLLVGGEDCHVANPCHVRNIVYSLEREVYRHRVVEHRRERLLIDNMMCFLHYAPIASEQSRNREFRDGGLGWHQPLSVLTFPAPQFDGKRDVRNLIRIMEVRDCETMRSKFPAGEKRAMAAFRHDRIDSNILQQLAERGFDLDALADQFLQSSPVTSTTATASSDLASYVHNFVAWVRVLERVVGAAPLLLDEGVVTCTIEVYSSTHLGPVVAIDTVASPVAVQSRQSVNLRNPPRIIELTEKHEGSPKSCTQKLSDFLVIEPVDVTRESANDAIIQVVHDEDWRDLPVLQHTQLIAIKKPVVFVVAIGSATEGGRNFAETLTTTEALYPYDPEDPDACLRRPFCFMTQHTPTISSLGSSSFLIIVAGVRSVAAMDAMQPFISFLLDEKGIPLTTRCRFFDWECKQWLDRHRFKGFLFAPRHEEMWGADLTPTVRSFSYGGPRSLRQQLCTASDELLDCYMLTTDWTGPKLRRSALAERHRVALYLLQHGEGRAGYAHVQLGDLAHALFDSCSIGTSLPLEVLTDVVLPFLSLFDAIHILARLCIDARSALGEVLQLLRREMYRDGGHVLPSVVRSSSKTQLPLDLSFRRLHPIELHKRLQNVVHHNRTYTPDSTAWFTRDMMRRWPIEMKAGEYDDDDDSCPENVFRFKASPDEATQSSTFAVATPWDTSTFEFFTDKDNTSKRFFIANPDTWMAARERFDVIPDDSKRLGWTQRMIGWSADVGDEPGVAPSLPSPTKFGWKRW